MSIPKVKITKLKSVSLILRWAIFHGMQTEHIPNKNVGRNGHVLYGHILNSVKDRAFMMTLFGYKYSKKITWYRWLDSNQRPLDPQSSALTS